MMSSPIHHTSVRAGITHHGSHDHLCTTGGGRPRSLCPHRRVTLASRALRFALVVGAIAQAFGNAGCKDTNANALHHTLTSLGVEDAPVLPPRMFRIFCDRSETAPCDHGVMMMAIEGVAHEAYRRPGSHIEVHLMGDTVAETRLIGSVTVPRQEDRGERAARAAEERFLRGIRPVLCLPLGAAFTSPRPRQSPIAESLDKIALGPTHGMPVEDIVFSDQHQVSDLGDFECRRLPSAQDFAARLRRHGLLGPGTYANTRVHFVVGDRGPIPRRDCPVTMGRERAVMQLWATALRAAGAREVTFHTELPDLSTLFAEVPDAGTASPTPTTITNSHTATSPTRTR